MNISTVVAVIGVLSAFLTATVALIGLRWNKQAVDAKDAQISALKGQIDALKDQSPAYITSQHSAVKSTLENQIDDLRKQLDISNHLLGQKTKEVSEDKQDAAAIMGRARTIFGIAEVELELRRLRETVFAYQRPRDFGEASIEIWSFYVRAMRILIPNEARAREITLACDEYIADFGIMPLIILMNHSETGELAYDIADDLIKGLGETTRTAEARFWKGLLDRAKEGERFESLTLPVPEMVKYIRANEIDQEERSSKT